MTSNAYGFVNKYADLPGSGSIEMVQARWHGAINKDTGYGYGNIGWFDGSVSGEPKDFDNPKATTTGGFGTTVTSYQWQQYFYERH